MLETITDRRNLEKTLVQVERNKGVGGVDNIQTDKLATTQATAIPCTRKCIIRQLHAQSRAHGRNTQGR
jgi:hypothetical protein